MLRDRDHLGTGSSGLGEAMRSTTDSVSASETAAAGPAALSLDDVSVEVAPQMTAREKFFGNWQHRSPAFRAYYSRPKVFWYERSMGFYKVTRSAGNAGESDGERRLLQTMKEFRLRDEDIRVPHGESENRWLGRHAVHFFNTIFVFFNRVSRLCTPETCPTMNAGVHFEYKWQTAQGKIVSVSAPKYMKLLFAWIDAQISNTSLFPVPDPPTTEGDQRPAVDVDFPEGFQSIVCTILKRLWRVVAHLYYGHFKRIRAIGLENELNTRFYHLAYFVLSFDLLKPGELRPLRSLILMRLPEHLTSSIVW
ncbi:Mob1/phocein family [Plasmodiophora brassicae]|nr:hypothetical protein PBRA_006503 [Plasmodiophora brassicae]